MKETKHSERPSATAKTVTARDLGLRPLQLAACRYGGESAPPKTGQTWNDNRKEPRGEKCSQLCIV